MSDRDNESIYMNKYCAYMLLDILNSNGDVSKIRNRLLLRSVTPIKRGSISIVYYINNKGRASTDRYCSERDSIIYINIIYNQFNNDNDIEISKDGVSFSLTRLETHYLHKLLANNLLYLEVS